MKYGNYFFFLILIFFHNQIVLGQNADELEDGLVGTKSIFINDKIIYVLDIQNNFQIKSINTEINPASHNEEIKRNKNILKKDETHFIIIGLNERNKLCIEIFEFLNNNISVIRELERYNNIPFNTPSFMEARYIEKDKLIIYTVESQKFMLYFINFNQNEPSSKGIEITSFQDVSNLNTNPSPYIKCDSFDGLSFFCIYYYKTRTSWIFNYKYQNIDINSESELSGNICNDICSFGNIIKVDDVIQKYLICYMRLHFSSNRIYNIICQYFYFENGKINTNHYSDLCKDSGRELVPRPLILYSYKNSMIIEFDYYPGEGETSRIILFSPDFKFIIHSYIYTYLNSDYESVNLLNNDNYMYLIIEREGSSFIVEKNLIESGEDENITLSNENSYQSNLNINNKEFVAFSLDENIILSRNNEIIEANSILDLSQLSSSQITYSIERKNKGVGVFNNYICFMANRAESNYVSFSLIKKITITSCYDSCQTCIEGQIGSFEENLCLNCTLGFYQNNSEFSTTFGFNCFNKNDSRVINYYVDSDNKLSLCNETCKTCNDSGHCVSCNENYYFKASKNDILEGLCFPEIKNNFYFDFNAYIEYKGLNNKIVLKECYYKCLTCRGEGNYTNNNCIECNSEYKKYPFSSEQCTNKTEKCLNERKYRIFNDNNIECIDECEGYIILDEGDNKGQCVDDCQNYKDPYLSKTMFLSLSTCENISYCISLENCIKGEKMDKYPIDLISHTCNKIINCNFSIFDEEFFIPDKNDTDSIKNESISTNIINSIDISNITEQILEKERDKIWRILNKNEYYFNYSNYSDDLIIIYKDLHEKLSIKENKGFGIYLILTINYIDFNITIYPYDLEDFVYENIIQNNLSFIHFKNVFQSSIQYESNEYLLIILLERICNNSAINELNYYFIKFNDDFYSYEKIDLIKDLGVTGKLNILYILKNYVNNNSSLSKRNKEYLVDNIRNMYKDNPERDLNNINDLFYNDICNLYTTEFGTDMTLNDRREEFYLNISLCEDTCILNKIIDKDTKIVKALCECDIKYNYISNKNAGKKDSIPHISYYNIESFLCIKETFNSKNLLRNYIFLVLLIVLIFFIIMIFAYIFYANKIFKRMFKFGNDNLSTSTQINDGNQKIKIIESNINTEKDNSKKNEMIISQVEKIEKSLSKISKIENQESYVNEENINNNINIDMNNKINFSKLDIGQKINPNSVIYSDNNKEIIEIKKVEKNSYKYNPPKKKNEKTNEKAKKSNNNERNLISSAKSRSSNVNKSINYRSSEISYEKISKEKPIYIDNLVNKGKMLENNYLEYPIKYENNIYFEFYRDALDLKDDENETEIKEILHHFNTMENYYESESKENRKKYKRNKMKKNYKIIKLLDGEDLFQESSINYESDNFNENEYYKKMKRNNTKESGEGSLFGSKLILTNRSKKILKKRGINKIKLNDLIEISRQESEITENTKEKGKKLKNENKRKTRLLRSLIRKDSGSGDSEYGKEPEIKSDILKTDYDYGTKNIIKSRLKKIGKDGITNDDNSTFTKNKNLNYKSFNAPFSEKNQLIFSKNYSDITDNSENQSNAGEDYKSGKKYNKNKKLYFKDEDNIKADKGRNKNKKLQYKKFKNKKEKIDIKESESIILAQSNKNDFDIFYEKALGTSIASFLHTGGEKNIIEENFCLFYWKYFKKRELFLVCFLDPKDTIPFFIRWSSFFFCLIFILLINCLFFLESNVHKRYEKASQGEKNDIVFYFKYEFSNTIYSTLISMVFKMIIIKLVLYRAFKVKRQVKKMMHHSFENYLEESELENLEYKRYHYLICYHIKIIIYFCLIITLSLFISYICIVYGAIFPNSINAFLFGLLFSFIISFLFCFFFCFIIVITNKIARTCKNRCLLSTYVVLSTVY